MTTESSEEWRGSSSTGQFYTRDRELGHTYGFADWRVLVIQLAERVRLAEILGEPMDGHGEQIRRLLLADGQ